MRAVFDWRKAQIVAVEAICADVRQVWFEIEGDLPPFSPGSHVAVRTRIGAAMAVRSYTVMPYTGNRLSIAVKQHANSRGGSRFIWGLAPGDTIEVTAPENRFELSRRAPHYLLMAGGIGVTPIYGMARALAVRGASLRMVYGAQNRASMAFAGELQGLLGDRLALYEADKGQFFDIEAEIAQLGPEDELYMCGPVGLLNTVSALWAKAGRSPSRLRFEVFGDTGKFTEAPFTVGVLNTDIAVTVAPDSSMLDALRAAGVEMISDCTRGECGLCAVDVVSADAPIDHRDVFFSAQEKAANTRMCACVSRLAGGHVVVDTGYRPEIVPR